MLGLAVLLMSLLGFFVCWMFASPHKWGKRHSFPIDQWLFCPDCQEKIGPPGLIFYGCLNCHLRIGLNYGTPDKPVPNPRRAPMILVRAYDANREDQLDKPRRELVIPYGQQFLSVKVLERGIRRKWHSPAPAPQPLAPGAGIAS